MSSPHFTIITYNVRMLSGLAEFQMGDEGESNDAKQQRATRLAQRLANEDADVVCLNEVFCDGGCRLNALGYDSTRVIFAETFRSRGYVVHEKFGAYGTEDSGLFIASKHVIRSLRFETFSCSSSAGTDKLADKGVCICNVRVNLSTGGVKDVIVALTHMQSDDDPKEEQNTHERSLQFNEIDNHITGTLGWFANNPVPPALILLGDFNVIGPGSDFDRQELPAVLKQLGNPVDAYAASNPINDVGCTFNGKLNTYLKNQYSKNRKATYAYAMRLDYILLFPKWKNISLTLPQIHNVDILRLQEPHEADLSDHFGLRARLAI